VSLHSELIEQAEHLAKREPKRPRQASLRRAVSAAYYALFHLLVNDAVRKLIPIAPDKLRGQAQRAFTHGEMRAACKQLTQGSELFLTLLEQPVEPEIRDVAEIFVELQQQRHAADYDLAQTFDQLDVLRTVEQSRAAMSGWRKVRNTPNANVFLAALLLNSRWNRSS